MLFRKGKYVLYFMLTVIAILALSMTGVALAAPADEPPLKEQVWTQVVESGLLLALFTSLASGIVVLFKYGVAWVTAKTAQIKNERIRNALLQVEDAVFTAVAQTAQLEADILKKAATDGKLTKEQAAEMKQLALDRAKKFLTDDIIDLAKKNVGDFDAWIDGLIEKNVRLGG